jgi:hypothetical protein
MGLCLNNLTTGEIENKLLLAADSERYTAWHLAEKVDIQDILQKISDLAKENLTIKR